MTSAETAKWALSPDTRRSLPELIGGKISALINEGELAPGATLPNEHELARRFGVGRSTIRTALQRLQQTGVLDVTRGRGWYVRPDSAISGHRSAEGGDEDRWFELGQLFDVRIALENMASSLAAVNATDEEIARIGEAFEAHRSTPGADVEELIRTDEIFHHRIVEASHNKVLVSVYDLIIPELQDFRRASFTPGSAKRSSDGHDLVLQFIRHHDEAGASTAMMSHLLTFASRLGHAVRAGRIIR